MKEDQLIKVGFIMRPHGLKGQLTARLNPECPEPSGVKYFIVERSDGIQSPHFVKHMNHHGEKTYLQFEGISTLEAAEHLSKGSLFLPKSELPEPAKGEFFDQEVEGFTVIDLAEGKLGTLKEVVRTGGGRLLSLEYQGRELLIPVNEHFVKGVNRRSRQLSVSLPDGYLEIL